LQILEEEKMVNFTDVGTLNSTMMGTIIAMVISFALTIYTVYLNYKQAKVNAQMTDVLDVLRKIEENTRKKR
jgi:hypothetical protein